MDKFEKRALARRARIVGHKTTSHEDAEDWDLAFRQKQTPMDRLAALVAIRRDILKVHPGKPVDWNGYDP